MNFPGSQPVSLDRQNLGMLRQELYKVTWKADGTRYMLLINFGDTYLVDTEFQGQACAGMLRAAALSKHLERPAAGFILAVMLHMLAACRDASLLGTGFQGPGPGSISTPLAWAWCGCADAVSRAARHEVSAIPFTGLCWMARWLWTRTGTLESTCTDTWRMMSWPSMTSLSSTSHGRFALCQISYAQTVGPHKTVQGPPIPKWSSLEGIARVHGLLAEQLRSEQILSVLLLVVLCCL